MKRRMAVWRGLVRCEGIFWLFARIYLSVSRCAVWIGLESLPCSLVLAFLLRSLYFLLMLLDLCPSGKRPLLVASCKRGFLLQAPFCERLWRWLRF